MLRTPTFHLNKSQKIIQHLKQTILHWLKNFGKFSVFYGEYIANPPRQKTIR